MRSTDERRPSAPTQSGAAVQCAHCIIDSLDRGGVDFIGAFAHGRDTGPIADLGQKLTHATSLKSCPNIALSSYLESHVGRRRCLFLCGRDEDDGDDDAHFCFLYDADLHKQEKRCRMRPPPRPPPPQRRHRFNPDDYSVAQPVSCPVA